MKELHRYTWMLQDIGKINLLIAKILAIAPEGDDIVLHLGDISGGKLWFVHWYFADVWADGFTMEEALEKFLFEVDNKREGPQSYREYIQSAAWKTKAKAAKERSGWRCQLCNKAGNNGDLHAHHRTYERLGHEEEEDITVLCSDCHAKFHDKLVHYG